MAGDGKQPTPKTIELIVKTVEANEGWGSLGEPVAGINVTATDRYGASLTFASTVGGYQVGDKVLVTVQPVVPAPVVGDGM